MKIPSDPGTKCYMLSCSKGYVFLMRRGMEFRASCKTGKSDLQLGPKNIGFFRETIRNLGADGISLFSEGYVFLGMFFSTGPFGQGLIALFCDHRLLGSIIRGRR